MNTFLSKINKICPKFNWILFNSYPDISGNSLALYKYIVRNRKDIVEKYHLIWTVGEMTSEQAAEILKAKTDIEKKHHIVGKKSLVGIVLFFFARFVVSTHGYFPDIRTSEKQIHINLWHGMPFKRIGRMLENVHTNGKSDEADMTIATSEVFQKIMAQSFGLSTQKVLVTGQPCNDVLNLPNASLRTMGISKENYNKIVIWMPTYRKSVIGDVRTDGNSNSFGVKSVLDNHFVELNRCLKSNRLLLLIKPHPMDELCRMKLPQSDNIRIFFNADLALHQIELYELLGQCDVLLTDYSSVFIDFMVTNKPIAFICNDLIEYEDSRGFCFDNPRKYMPGEFISNYMELEQYFNAIDEKRERWGKKYTMVKRELNPY